MKRILFFFVMTLCAKTTYAQETKEQIQKSEERAKNLQILLDKYSDTNCGDGIIDGFGNSVRDAAVLAIANSVKLEGLYYRQIGQTKDGVTDVTIVKPKLEDWTELLTTVTGEAASIKNAVDNAKAAGEQMKQLAENAKNNKNPKQKQKRHDWQKLKQWPNSLLTRKLKQLTLRLVKLSKMLNQSRKLLASP